MSSSVALNTEGNFDDIFPKEPAKKNHQLAPSSESTRKHPSSWEHQISQFLRQTHPFNIQVCIPCCKIERDGLSTASDDVFSVGIDE